MEGRALRYLLDTHAVLWSVEDDSRLGPRARDELRQCTASEIALSAITLFEIAMLHEKERIRLSIPIANYLGSLERRFNVLPIVSVIAADAVKLTLPHGDPFDRIIMATARYHGLSLITRDEHMAGSGLVKTLW
jgi:PIN domain nuclease of toxin-antitoxin system